MEDEDRPTKKMSGLKIEDRPATNGTPPKGSRNGEMPGANSSTSDGRDDPPHNSSPGTSKARDDGTLTPNTPQTLSSRPSRKQSQMAPPSQPLLFDALPDMTSEAIKTFQVIPDCLYGSRGMGSTDNEILDCDCKEDWREYSPWNLYNIHDPVYPNPDPSSLPQITV